MADSRNATFSIAFFLIILPLFGTISLILFLLILPAWNLFLQLNHFGLCSLLLLIGAPFLGLINLPSPIKLKGRLLNFNLLAFWGPIGILIYTAQMITLQWKAILVIPFLISWLIFHVFGFANSKGIYVFGIAVSISSVCITYFLQLFFYSQWEVAFWWGFALQYIAVLLVSSYRSLGMPKNKITIVTDPPALSIGGAGIRDALWTAPSTTLVTSYIAYYYWGPSFLIH